MGRVCREMEKTVAVGNSCSFYRLVRNTGPRKSSVGCVVKESDGPLIHSKLSARHF